MDWSKGFSATYYATKIDSTTWRDIERFEIIDGSINKNESGLQISADLTCRRYDYDIEQWVRVYLDAKQNGTTTHVPLFTGLATSPRKDLEGRLVTTPLECYSVLKPCEDVLLQRGWYAPAEISCDSILRNLLKPTPAPVEISDNIPSLSNAIIAGDGESNLSMAESILNSINWRMRISGDGTIYIEPKPLSPEVMFDALNNDSIEPNVEMEKDMFDCPNVFRAISDDLSAVARDDNPSSILSTVSRGREVWMEETNCDLSDNESIADYALRRLKEEQQIATTVSYDRRFNPNIEVSDIIRLHYPEQGIDGVFQITSQSISLGYGCKTSEEVKSV